MPPPSTPAGGATKKPLSLSPATLEINLQRGETPSTTLTVVNTSDNPLAFK